jgi:hypothetical protein
MTTLVAKGFSLFLEELLAAFSALFSSAFTPRASHESAEIAPPHVSARARRLMRADY